MVDAAPESCSSRKSDNSEKELSDAPAASLSDSDSGTEGDGRAQPTTQTKRTRKAAKPAQPNRSTGPEEAKRSAVPGPQGAVTQKPRTKLRRRATSGADTTGRMKQGKGNPSPGPGAG